MPAYFTCGLPHVPLQRGFLVLASRKFPPCPQNGEKTVLDHGIKDGRRTDELVSRTSTTLLRRAVAAEPAAWTALVKKYGRAVYVWCRAGGVPKADAPDVAQDVLVNLVRKLGGFRHDREGATFRGWLRRIAQRKANEYHRFRRRRGVVPGGMEVDVWGLPEPESADEESSCVMRCPDIEQLVLAARIRPRDWAICRELVAGLATAHELAERYDLQFKRVYVIKFRVLKRLRRAQEALSSHETARSPTSGRRMPQQG